MCCRPFWLWLPFFHVEKQLFAGVLVCVLLCYQKRPEKTKTKAAPAWTSTGLPWQLSMVALSVLLSLPHMAEDKQTSPCDPPGCTPPPQKHKNTSLLFTARIFLLILNKSQPHVNPPMWCSHPSLCFLAWKCRRWGVPRGMEITNIEVTDLEVCLNRAHAATAHPKSIQWLCCAFEGQGKQGGNSAWIWRMKKHHLVVVMWCYKLP